jgi:hypothetical protein
VVVVGNSSYGINQKFDSMQFVKYQIPLAKDLFPVLGTGYVPVQEIRVHFE